MYHFREDPQPQPTTDCVFATNFCEKKRGTTTDTMARIENGAKGDKSKMHYGAMASRTAGKIQSSQNHFRGTDTRALGSIVEFAFVIISLYGYSVACSSARIFNF